MAGFVKLNISVFADTPPGNQRLQVFVEETSAEIPLELFVYQRRPMPANVTTSQDIFSNISSSAGLEDYPIDEPGTDSPFFRLSLLDLVFRSPDLLDKALATIKSDITCLVKELDEQAIITETTIFVFGGLDIPNILPTDVEQEVAEVITGIDWTATGTHDVFITTGGKLFVPEFLYDASQSISGSGTPPQFKLKTSAGDITSVIQSVSDEVDELSKFTIFQDVPAAQQFLILGGVTIQIEIVVASTFTTHLGLYAVTGKEL